MDTKQSEAEQFDLVQLHGLFTKYAADIRSDIKEHNLNIPKEFLVKEYNFEEFCKWWSKLTLEKQIHWSSKFNKGYAAEVQRIRELLFEALKILEPPAANEVWIECQCNCHGPNNEQIADHCIPCCLKCPICGQNIAGDLDAHVKEIHLEPPTEPSKNSVGRTIIEAAERDIAEDGIILTDHLSELELHMPSAANQDRRTKLFGPRIRGSNVLSDGTTVAEACDGELG